MKRLISIVIPVYNEEKNLGALLDALTAALSDPRHTYEFLFVDDGSSDKSMEVIETLQKKDLRVRFVQFSRNFGKEAATSAGIIHAKGDAVVVIDADLQHPPEVIPEFIRRWEAGTDVVIGVREPRRGEGFIRTLGSRLLTYILNTIGDTSAPPRATDFRLIDRRVADAFGAFGEHRRLTRSLIDWLGFKREYVLFAAAERDGANRYGYGKLISLFFSTIIAHSRLPLFFAGYLGVLITAFSTGLGIFVIIEQFLMGDPLGIEVSGAAMLAIMILFLNGITLMSLGLVAVYIGTIHEETAKRPLYVVRRSSLK